MSTPVETRAWIELMRRSDSDAGSGYELRGEPVLLPRTRWSVMPLASRKSSKDFGSSSWLESRKSTSGGSIGWGEITHAPAVV